MRKYNLVAEKPDGNNSNPDIQENLHLKLNALGYPLVSQYLRENNIEVDIQGGGIVLDGVIFDLDVIEYCVKNNFKIPSGEAILSEEYNDPVWILRNNLKGARPYVLSDFVRKTFIPDL